MPEPAPNPPPPAPLPPDEIESRPNPDPNPALDPTGAAEDASIAADKPPAMPQEPTPMLDIHTPHESIHTWRDFFIHIATIVVGLCIAVCLEQTVEFFHHREQIARTREELSAERDLNRLHRYPRAVDVFRFEVAELVNNLVVLHYLQQHPGTPQEKLPGILLWRAYRTPFSDSAWETAQQSTIAALMPQDEVYRYSLLYSRTGEIAHSSEEIRLAIAQAGVYAVSDPDPSHLTPAQLATEVDLTDSALEDAFNLGRWLAALSGFDPSFTPAVTQSDLDNLSRLTESEKDPHLAAAIAITNARLPEDERLPIPASGAAQPQR